MADGYIRVRNQATGKKSYWGRMRDERGQKAATRKVFRRASDAEIWAERLAMRWNRIFGQNGGS